MDDLAPYLISAQKLTSIFGYWPSFHDAEVLEVHLDRGDIRPEAGVCVFPSLSARFHLWELTNVVNPDGFFVLRHHTLARILFQDVRELRLEGFHFQNVLFGLGLRRISGEPLTNERLSVTFDDSFGLSASFTCSALEVLEAIPCNPDGSV